MSLERATFRLYEEFHIRQGLVDEQRVGATASLRYLPLNWSWHEGPVWVVHGRWLLEIQRQLTESSGQ